MTMKYVFDLLVDMRVVRNEDIGAVLVMLLGLRGCAFDGLLCSIDYRDILGHIDYKDILRLLETCQQHRRQI